MSTYYYNLVKNINGEKFVFLPKDEKEPPFIENLKYIIAPFKKGNEKNIFFTFLWFFQIFFKLIFEKPDFLHIGKIRPIVYFFLIFKIFKIKIILYFHGLDYYEMKNKSLLKRKFVNYAIKKADLTVCANKYVLKIIKENVRPKREYILYPGVDLSYLNKINEKFKEEKKDKFILLTVANLVKRKGIDTVLRALNILKDEFDFKYYIIGKGPEEKNLKDLTKKLDLQDRVFFLGELDEEKFKYYKICDVFLMPSRVIEEEGSFEGFGIVFLEASFFKKFLIGAKTGGIPEAIINGETGILLDDPEDYIKLSEIIKDYFKNPYKYEKIKENAYKRVLKEFDIKKLIRDYEKKLFEILK
ncbi:MAG: glycosyltransferase family 4 protein [candidate division WOR-3 bacterium]